MKFTILLLLIVLMAGCKKEKPEGIQVDFDYQTFLQMRSQWEQLNLKSYNFTYSSHGFGCFANDITVLNNQIINVQPDSSICRMGMKPALALTIDSIFDQIDYRYHNPIIIKKTDEMYWYCYAIKIKYDSVYSFPMEYEFLQTGEQMQFEDLQSGQKLSNFSTLKP